jgi:hypothetical protein
MNEGIEYILKEKEIGDMRGMTEFSYVLYERMDFLIQLLAVIRVLREIWMYYTHIIKSLFNRQKVSPTSLLAGIESRSDLYLNLVNKEEEMILKFVLFSLLIWEKS